MDRRMTVVIAAGAGLIVGAAAGLLTGRTVDADWFEAVGTWLGVIVSSVAIALAFLIFRAEDFMRRMESSRREREKESQELERLKTEARQREGLAASQRADASLVTLRDLTPRGLKGRTVGSEVLRAYSVEVVNSSSFVATNVSFRLKGMSVWYMVALSVAPGAVHREENMIPPEEEIVVTASRHIRMLECEIIFMMHGQTWVVTGENPEAELWSEI